MADAAEGKAAAKAELRARVGLADVDAPLVAVVTRLTHQKGIHLIKHAAWRALERGGQWLLLGSAPDPRVQVWEEGFVPGVRRVHIWQVDDLRKDRLMLGLHVPLPLSSTHLPALRGASPDARGRVCVATILACPSVWWMPAAHATFEEMRTAACAGTRCDSRLL